jgi:L-ribulose-5-phosphate 3-epimerase
MQGRLSPQVGSRIQAFPWDHWRDEFPLASTLGFRLMEWTLDDEGLYENPLMTVAGRAEIRELMGTSGVTVASVTGDFLMQAPPFRGSPDERRGRTANLAAVIEACGELSAHTVVWPLVDDGRLVADDDEEQVLRIVGELAAVLRGRGVRIAFESDYAPAELTRFMARLPHDVAGVNYDSGNSAALGFDCAAELQAYGDRVINVHIKDRVRNGGSVPLGTGAADLPQVARNLRAAGYGGNYVLQTARASDGDHASALVRARGVIAPLIAQ